MKYALTHGTRICQFVPTSEECFPVASALKWVQVADDVTDADTFVNNAVVKAPPPPAPPPPPTLDDVYDQVLRDQRVVKAIVMAINDGTLVVGGNKTGTQLKSIIKAKM